MEFSIPAVRGRDSSSRRSEFPSQDRQGLSRKQKKEEKIMSNYLKKLIVEPGSKIRLKDFDPGYHGKHESRKAALPEIEKNRQKMQELQYLMYAENKHSLLIVLQGLDAGGKDGVVRHVLTGMNPSGCISVNFKQPTAEDLSHDFLCRGHPHVPGKSSFAISNRSPYPYVLVGRVHCLVPA